MGFFAEAGPLQIFVSNHLIPEEYEFESTHEPAYMTREGDKITSGCEVRVKIVGTRVDANEIVSFLNQKLLAFNLFGNFFRFFLLFKLIILSSSLQFAVASIKEHYLGLLGNAA